MLTPATSTASTQSEGLAKSDPPRVKVNRTVPKVLAPTVIPTFSTEPTDQETLPGASSSRSPWFPWARACVTREPGFGQCLLSFRGRRENRRTFASRGVPGEPSSITLATGATPGSRHRLLLDGVFRQGARRVGRGVELSKTRAALTAVWSVIVRWVSLRALNARLGRGTTARRPCSRRSKAETSSAGGGRRSTRPARGSR